MIPVPEVSKAQKNIIKKTYLEIGVEREKFLVDWGGGRGPSS